MFAGLVSASGQLQARLLGIEAAVLDSAEASDASSGGGGYAEPSPALAASTLAASTAGEAEADSCGYEGDVGESAKLIPSVRRPASVVVVAPPGAPAKAVSCTPRAATVEYYRVGRLGLGYGYDINGADHNIMGRVGMASVRCC